VVLHGHHDVGHGDHDPKKKMALRHLFRILAFATTTNHQPLTIN
jgi:hypothetical protein